MEEKLVRFLLLVWSAALYGEVHVLMTGAVISLQYEARKQEYLTSFFSLQSYGIEPWIIIATNMHASFFDELSHQVLYPQKNNLSIRNKGVNEAMSLRASIPHLPFADDDIVIKLTGRYCLHKRSLLDLIETSSNDYDVWGIFGKHFVSPDHLFTGCFAMRWKYLKKMLSEMDCVAAEIDYLPVEKLFAEFIDKEELRVKKIDTMYVRARIFFSGEGTDILEF